MAAAVEKLSDDQIMEMQENPTAEIETPISRVFQKIVASFGTGGIAQVCPAGFALYAELMGDQEISPESVVSADALSAALQK